MYSKRINYLAARWACSCGQLCNVYICTQKFTKHIYSKHNFSKHIHYLAARWACSYGPCM